MKAMSEKSGVREQLAQLPLELSSGEEIELRDLREDKRVVLLIGRASEVTRCINLAARSGSDLLKCDVSIVPVFTDLDDDTAGWQAMKDGSDKGAWDPWLARPTSRADCIEWQNNDRLTMAEKNKDSATVDANKEDRLLRVYIIRKDGKIGARTVGPPAWAKLVKQIERLPERDEYGTP
ncbi:hypothetical protein T484DRAFT_2775039 [Baffinella frigidus]|nr:hypothetical protein T484DRAFT_2775039 [Cryptophyta sp. CCMP2293]